MAEQRNQASIRTLRDQNGDRPNAGSGRNGEPADEIDPAFATPDAPNLRVFAAHSYELDVLGRRTKQTFANGRYDAYRYDAIGQVVGADYALLPNGNAGQRSRTQQLNYDAMGNRLSFIDSGVETRYTSNNVNQHIRRRVGWAGEYRRCSGEAQDARAGVSCQYTDISAATSPPDGGWRYDARGNLRSDGSRRFRWDGEDHLPRAVVPNAAEGKQRVDYTYDSKSRRVIRKQGREHTLYIYDQWNCIAEKRGLSVLDEARRVRFSMPRESNQYTVDGRNSDSVLATRYVWGTDISGSLQHRDLSGADGDEVEARRVRYAMNRMSNQRAGGVDGLLHADEVTNGCGQTKGYYFHYDGNGNVTAVTNAKGRRAASYTYDAFGNTLEAKGNYAEQNSYRFSTKPLDEVTGFYYYGYRYYDPQTGRWPSRDPIGERGGLNLHALLANRNLNEIDNLGNAPVLALIMEEVELGKCGAFRWPGAWQWSPSRDASGIILQEVEMNGSHQEYDNEKKLKDELIEGDGVPQINPYHEVWDTAGFVSGVDLSDTFSLNGRGAGNMENRVWRSNTKGTFTIKGWARYYPNLDSLVKMPELQQSGWMIGHPDTGAGGNQWSGKHNPGWLAAGATASAVFEHSITVKWDCCGDELNKTEVVSQTP